MVNLATLPEETLSGLCQLKAGRESAHWASARGLASVCDAADAANASVCASRGPQQPHLQHGAAVSANDATGLRFSYLSAFARGSPVDTHDVRRPCPCGTRLRPELVLGRDCHRLTHGHNRGVTRPGMLSQSLRPYRKRLVSSLTALGLLTKTRIKNVGVYRP